MLVAEERWVAKSKSAASIIQAVLTKIPSDCGLAFVVIQHLDPAWRSVLRGLRSRVIPFPVFEVSNRASISGGTLSIGPITSRDKRHPIDDFKGAGGLGLVSVEERTRIAGATLSIQGRPGRGTRVKLAVPIRGATREKSTHSAGR